MNPRGALLVLHLFLRTLMEATSYIVIAIITWLRLLLWPLLLGRPLGYLMFSLMALIRDPIYQYFSKGFRGQPSLLLWLFLLLLILLLLQPTARRLDSAAS